MVWWQRRLRGCFSSICGLCIKKIDIVWMQTIRFFKRVLAFFNLCPPAYYHLLVLRRTDNETYCFQRQRYSQLCFFTVAYMNSEWKYSTNFHGKWFSVFDQIIHLKNGLEMKHRLKPAHFFFLLSKKLDATHWVLLGTGNEIWLLLLHNPVAFHCICRFGLSGA